MTATLTPITSTGKNQRTGKDYFIYVKATEYYTDKNGLKKAASRWIGKGAESLGLSGEPDVDVMTLLAAGYSPKGRAYPLAENAGPKHKNALDCTLSPPKSVSLAFALETPERRDLILECQGRAVAAVVRFIEEQELLRANRGAQGCDSIATKGMVASAHFHMANRNLEPFLHVHLLMYNVVQGVDGQWSCLETQELFRYQKVIGAIFRSEYAKELHEHLGYGIEHTLGANRSGEENGLDAFEIAGIGPEVRRHFSSRAKEVEKFKLENPTAWHNRAALATRKHKDEPTWAELEVEWAESMDKLSHEHPEWMPDMQSLKGRPSTTRNRSPEEIATAIHATEACITRPQMLEALAKDSVGLGVEFMQAKEKEFATELRHIKPERQPGRKSSWSTRPALKHVEERYTAQWMVDVEKEVIDRGERMSKDMRHQVPKAKVERVIREFEERKSKEFGTNFKLKPEQVNMNMHCAHDTGAISMVIGWAGTGKTTASECMKLVFEADNKKVVGAATSWKASNKLQKESHMPCMAIAAMARRIEKGIFKPDANTVLMIDEASLLGTKSFNTISKAFEEVGGKIVVFGDPHQLQSVESGSPMRALIEKLGCAELNQITRQKTAEGLDLANTLYIGSHHKRGERSRRDSNLLGRAIYTKLEEQGSIHTFDSGKEVIEGLAKAYLDSPLPTEQKIAIAATNADVQEIGHAIRKGLKAQGKLGSRDHECVVQLDRGEDTLKLSTGDRIRFKAGLPDKAFNNEDGEILHIKPNFLGGLTIKVKMDDNAINGQVRTFSFDTLEFDNFTYAYSMTVFGSQGQTAEEAFCALGPSTDTHLMTVGATRAKMKTHCFLIDDDADEIAKAMGKHRLKANALEEGLVEQTVKPANDPDFDQKKAQALQQTQETLKAIRTQIKLQQDQSRKRGRG